MRRTMKKMSPSRFPTLDTIDVAHKRVLVRMDLNVPMTDGRVTDDTRVSRLLPTLRELLQKNAKIIILSHLGRPDGHYVPSLSLAPLVDALSSALAGVVVKFGVDCIGPEANSAVKALKSGEILLLENVRFHAGEEKNDATFAKKLAAHGDIYVNDAFSCSHRAHASVVGITRQLPCAAGRLMEEELRNLETLFENPKRPLTAIIGGAKVSSKLELLENLIHRVDTLIIGGAMANTFLLARGFAVGKSLVEPNLKETARRILEKARGKCHIVLPMDVLHTLPSAIKASNVTVSGTVNVKDKAATIPAGEMIFDIGNQTLADIAQHLAKSKTVIWNGPLGIFEQKPGFSTIWLAREIDRLTRDGTLKSIVGGGDTVAAINTAGFSQSYTYISTGGGAFLEWMEGKELPGVEVLQAAA